MACDRSGAVRNWWFECERDPACWHEPGSGRSRGLQLAIVHPHAAKVRGHGRRTGIAGRLADGSTGAFELAQGERRRFGPRVADTRGDRVPTTRAPAHRGEQERRSPLRRSLPARARHHVREQLTLVRRRPSVRPELRRTDVGIDLDRRGRLHATGMRSLPGTLAGRPAHGSGHSVGRIHGVDAGPLLQPAERRAVCREA